MSHEFRTPLTSIIGFADILGQQIDDANREFVHLIQGSAQRLMNTLGAILDLTQLEGHSLALHPQPFDLSQCTASIMPLYEALAREKNLSLEMVPAPFPAANVYLDPSGYRRILDNLVTNAVKFTRKGSVTVSIETQAADAVLKVADTGIGIRKEFLPHIFDDFVQESSGIARTYSGSGLGLAITRRLVDQMGGAIEAQSKKGQGSTFTVRFPLHAS
jgi:signal transduction histidine kinase